MNRDLLLIGTSLLTWGIGESAFFYFQPLYLEQLGATPIMIGSILGAVGIAMTIAHIPAGYYADRFGRRRMMWAAWVTGLVSAWVMTLARSLPVFTVGILLYGLTAFVVAPLNSYITAARGKWSVGRALTFGSALYNTGAISGPLIGGYIGDHFGLHKIYLFSAWIFLLSTVMIFFIRSQAVEVQKSEAGHGLFQNRGYVIFLVVIFVAIFAMYLPQPLTSNFLQNQRGVDVGQIGILGSIGSLGNVILISGVGFFNPMAGFLFGQIAVGIFALLLWGGNQFPWFATGYFVLGGYRAARTMITAQIKELTSDVNMGLAYGIAETVSGFAIILAPPLAGLLYDFNPLLMYQASCVALISSIVLSILYSLIKNRRQNVYERAIDE